MNAQQKFENVEEMFKEAEDTFRKGAGTLSNWTDEARDLIENKPAVLLAALGVSGFVTGALLRHGISTRRSRPGTSETPANPLPADPIVLFVTGIFAGIIAGPKIIQDAIHGLNHVSGGSTLREVDGPRLYNRNAPMNEKPFEKI